LRAQLNAARAEGIPLEPAQLRRTTPSSENAAKQYRQAFALLERAEKEKRPTYRLLSEKPNFASPNVRRQVRVALGEFRLALDLLDQAARKPRCDFEREWEKGFDLQFNEYIQFHNAMKLRNAEALLLSAEGKPMEALDILRANARTCAHIGEEPTIIGKLTQVAEESYVAGALEIVLGTHGKTPGVTAAAREVVQAFGAPVAMRPAFETEVVASRLLIKTLADPQRAEELSRMLGSSATGSDPTPKILARATRISAVRSILEARLIEHWRGVLSDLPKDPADVRGATKALRDADNRLQARTDWSHSLAQIFSPALSGMGSSVGSSLARRRCLFATIDAVETRNSTGQFPRSLTLKGKEALDPFDGSPLRYKKLRNGVRFYSVGQDTFDDGGLRKSPGGKSRGSDIVVEYPFRPPSSAGP
jgi:hypothetical protein